MLASCGQPDSIVEPGPGDTTTTTTTLPDESAETDDDDGDGDEVITNAETTTTAPTDEGDADQDAPANAVDASSGEGGNAQAPTFALDEDSINAGAFTELAESGLVLSLDEQACVDDTAGGEVNAGTTELEAVIAAVQTCATPAAIDDFSAELIVAGGAPLPPTEAACVSSRLQSSDEYGPFWAALLDEEPFDFLVADIEVQNRFLDLYTECVSIGRAVGQQSSATLSAPTIGCIDGLYDDREFVRITIEADLSGNADDQARVSNQISTCLTSQERTALGLE